MMPHISNAEDPGSDTHCW